jgi:hypothetical protein
MTLPFTIKVLYLGSPRIFGFAVTYNSQETFDEIMLDLDGFCDHLAEKYGDLEVDFKCKTAIYGFFSSAADVREAQEILAAIRNELSAAFECGDIYEVR